jgi:predicted esterase
MHKSSTHIHKSNEILRFEFPELPETLATLVTGEYQPACLTAQLPENYSVNQKFPLFVFLTPYGRGEHEPFSREVIGLKDFICVHLPTFKVDYDASEPWRGILMTMCDYSLMSKACRTMLEKLFQSIPNIEIERSALGGFSNGGYATAILLAGHDEFILQHFRSFFFLEGNAPLVANVLHKPIMKQNRYLVMRGDQLEGDPVADLRVHIDRALESEAHAHELDFTFVTMKGAGHEVPENYAMKVGKWVRGEAI